MKRATRKVVIDATNPLLPDMSGLEDHRLSGAQRLAAAAPAARIVKAFNQTGAANMCDATGYSHPPVIYLFIRAIPPPDLDDKAGHHSILTQRPPGGHLHLNARARSR